MVVNVQSSFDSGKDQKEDIVKEQTSAEALKRSSNIALENLQEDKKVTLPVEQVGSTSNLIDFESVRNPNYTQSSGANLIDYVINKPDAIDEYQDNTIGAKEGVESDLPMGFNALSNEAQEELKRFNRVGDTIVDRYNKVPNTNEQANGNLLPRITSIIDHTRAGFDIPTQIEPDPKALNMTHGELRASLEPQNQSIEGTARANATAQPLGKILNRFDSIERIPVANKYKTVIKPDMLAIGLALTEKSFAEGMYSDPKAYKEAMLEEASNQELDSQQKAEVYKKIKDFEDKMASGDTTAPMVAKNQGLEVLGREIAQEYLIKTGRQDRIGEIDAIEAQHLAGYFKELWSKNHSVDGDNIFRDGTGLVTRQNSTQDGTQINYQLTPLGVEYLTGRSGGSRDVLNILFPPKNVRPSKRPLPQGRLPGAVGEMVRDMSGILGTNKKSFPKDEYLQEAMNNLSTIGHVVNKRRNKLLLITALPSIAQLNPATAEGSKNPEMWMAEINSLGTKKYEGIMAEKIAQDRRRQAAKDRDEEFTEVEINPAEEFARLKIKASRTLQSIQMEREGENFLTYSLQGYSGRIAPQQTLFNPTSNKDVRFVTTSGAAVQVTKGSKKEKVLRQMYALMLLPSIAKGVADAEGQGTARGADMLLPDAREFQLEANTRQLYEWGQRLSTALDNTMSETLYDTIANEVVGDVDYQQSTAAKSNISLGLDPSIREDKELIDAIAKRGEDGLAFMDGVIDFYNYKNAMDKGIPFRTFFNAYIDGKTNGLATNGFQHGHLPTGFATGVIRNGKISLLDQDKDLRDYLQEANLQILENDTGGSATSNFNKVLDDFMVVSRVIFSDRELNKQTTMTWGYGAELATFKKSIDDVVDKFVAKYQFEGQKGQLSPEGLAFLQSLDKVMGVEKVIIRTGESSLPSDIREALVDNIHALYVKGLQQTLSPDVIKARTLLRGAAIAHTFLDELMVFKTHSGYELNVGGKVSKGLTEGTKSGQYGFDTVDGKGNTITQYNYETAQTPQAKTSQKDAGEVTWGGALPAPIQSIDGSVVAMTVAGDSWKRLSTNSKKPYVHTIYDAFKMDVDSYETVLAESNKNWMKINEDWNYMQQALESLDNAMGKFKKKLNTNPDAPIPKHTVDYIMHLFSPVREGSNTTNLKYKLLKLDEELNFLKAKTKSQADKLVAIIEKDLYDSLTRSGKELKDVTMREYSVFVSKFASRLNLRNQIRSHIGLMDRNKKILLKKIKEEGLGFNFNGEFIPLQYYAH